MSELLPFERMQIQVNTDSSIAGHQELTASVEAKVRTSLKRFASQLTRVEVHLADENRAKGGQDDKRCAMEARIEGRNPVVVSDNAATIDAAVRGATQKLRRALDTSLGKLRNRKA